MPAGDQVALAKAITYLAKHPQEAANFGQKAHELAIQLFDQKKNCAKLFELFKSVAHEKGKETPCAE